MSIEEQEGQKVKDVISLEEKDSKGVYSLGSGVDTISDLYEGESGDEKKDEESDVIYKEANKGIIVEKKTQEIPFVAGQLDKYPETCIPVRYEVGVYDLGVPDQLERYNRDLSSKFNPYRSFQIIKEMLMWAENEGTFKALLTKQYFNFKQIRAKDG